MTMVNSGLKGLNHKHKLFIVESSSSESLIIIVPRLDSTIVAVSLEVIVSFFFMVPVQNI